jgi:hypothetical protein
MIIRRLKAANFILTYSILNSCFLSPRLKKCTGVGGVAFISAAKAPNSFAQWLMIILPPNRAREIFIGSAASFL